MKRIRRKRKMSAIVFEIPEKQTTAAGDIYFFCKLSKPGYSILHDLEWQKDSKCPIPVLSVQKQITELRATVLRLLMENKTIFRNPPTFDSLQAITPPWGILIRNNNLEWSSVNKWQIDESLLTNNAIVRLVLTGVEISRSYIYPVWSFSIQQILPEKTPEGVIDFTFDEPAFERDDAKSVASVASDDFINEDTNIITLHNPNERKCLLKQQIRELLKKASDAQHAADDAMDRFFDEYDLSEDESDFSDNEA